MTVTVWKCRDCGNIAKGYGTLLPPRECDGCHGIAWMIWSRTYER